MAYSLCYLLAPFYFILAFHHPIALFEHVFIMLHYAVWMLIALFFSSRLPFRRQHCPGYPPPVEHLGGIQVVLPAYQTALHPLSTSSGLRTQRGQRLLATDRPPHQQPLPPSFATSGYRAAAPGTGERGSTSRQPERPCIDTNSRPRGWTAGATSDSISLPSAYLNRALQHPAEEISDGGG